MDRLFVFLLFLVVGCGGTSPEPIGQTQPGTRADAVTETRVSVDAPPAEVGDDAGTPDDAPEGDTAPDAPQAPDDAPAPVPEATVCEPSPPTVACLPVAASPACGPTPDGCGGSVDCGRCVQGNQPGDAVRFCAAGRCSTSGGCKRVATVAGCQSSFTMCPIDPGPSVGQWCSPGAGAGTWCCAGVRP